MMRCCILIQLYFNLLTFKNDPTKCIFGKIMHPYVKEIPGLKNRKGAFGEASQQLSFSKFICKF